ncbi:helix-turn-helix transcriptional regulator [Tamlana sp. 2_MG-2023]|uniref:helix-turn-helix domain-containing protein n=1 Tax=unclassified Tamlana TaxID=2614803 RepID=UPI0026E1FBAE|nr:MULTISPECIES: helix-turn-helix transcriptional regulator [unclassified Tamlana]MDO6759406.1 helix-turn-helix transcriptional regulator [Tamlana sp. 2_MG-2023]MDO6790455.1 helix-turn-helix transcriptional regulator [Tamlana sp. 1_MG-2023]
MVNNEDFIKRLQKVMDYYGESASSFAEKIDVQRSSISHILSGRNKPSLDFVLKILSAFPEVNLYWLLNGKGEFPQSEEKLPKPENRKSQNPQTNFNFEEITVHKTHSLPTEDKTIDRIVIFYSDGTFKNYMN